MLPLITHLSELKYICIMRNIHKLICLTCFVILSSFGIASVPTGYYYQTRGKSKGELKTTLSEISHPLRVLSYGSGEGATWEGFFKTDRNDDNSIKDNYSAIVRYFNSYNSIPEMAIEHSFPKSWWGGHENNAYRDLFHLYPADSRTNSAKNNFPLGEVASGIVYYNTRSTIGTNSFGTVYSGNAFEPADEFKGDFARSYFYVSTIYESLFPLWNSPMLKNELYPMWQPWAIDLLLKWHRQDPVSVKELTRNEAIFSIQANRNPFIDHPELAEHIWGNKMDEPFIYPTETSAFLVSPTRNFKVDFGAVYQMSEISKTLFIKGVNINATLKLTLSNGNIGFSLERSSVSVSEAMQGIDVLVKAAPKWSGTISDTLNIQGGGLQGVVRVPLSLVVSPDLVVLEPSDVTPSSGILRWLNDSQAESYKLSVYQNDTQAGDLMISAYYEGASNDKAIELFNGTGKDVDLSKYQLKKQTNGAGEYVVNYKLSGTLQNNKSCVVVYMYSTNEALRSKATHFADSVVAFNGNDALALFRNGIPVDVVGKKDGGADFYWGQDKYLKRKKEITHPTNLFSMDEWNVYPYSEVSLIGVHSMDLSVSANYLFEDVAVGSSNVYYLGELLPNTKYTYRVSAVRGGISMPSVNSAQLKTMKLEPPVALEATDITSNSFVANWEDYPYADDYMLDVFHIQGNTIREVEGFDALTSSGGSLPAGWSGNVSGNYTTEASSGVKIPSVGLKKDKEWLQTKEYPSAVSKLGFMYRFPSSGAGSYLIFEAKNKDGWQRIDSIVYVNTSKYFPTYDFPKSKEFNTFKFTYYKSSGNLALDDVSVDFGDVDTVFVVKNKAVLGSQSLVESLNSSFTYFYRLSSRYKSASSAYSEPMQVVLLQTSVQKPNSSNLKITITSNSIVVSGTKAKEHLRLYSLSGQLLYNKLSDDLETVITDIGKGVYILQIDTGMTRESYKLIK